MLNLICITGRLVADPNLIECASGTKVCKFTIACDRDVKDANGERATDFIDCIAWGKAGEAIAAMVSLGYTNAEAAAVIAKLPQDLPVDEMIKRALKSLAMGR